LKLVFSNPLDPNATTRPNDPRLVFSKIAEKVGLDKACVPSATEYTLSLLTVKLVNHLNNVAFDGQPQVRVMITGSAPIADHVLDFLRIASASVEVVTCENEMGDYKTCFFLGGGFQYCFFHHYEGKIPILTNNFQLG